MNKDKDKDKSPKIGDTPKPEIEQTERREIKSDGSISETISYDKSDKPEHSDDED